jgi:hypothetical protein
MEIVSGIDQIQKQCEINEHFLKELLKGNYAFLRSYLQGELRFGVARSWNSWYPSYFNVKGGCYVLIPGDWKPDNNEETNKETSIGVIVIDPGFNFIDILRETYQIEPQDITTVIVTHFHPDHMVGLLEYATIMTTSKQHCDIYLNETTFATFRSLQSTYINIHELRHGQNEEIICYPTIHNDYWKVIVKAIGVHHNEIGNQHRSLGLVLEIKRFENKSVKEVSKYRIGILGDTDGSIDYIQDYINNFQNVDIFILHLGTFSNKNFGKGGKHLYIEGVKNILQQMSKQATGKGIVVLSEFGLELADEYQLYRNLQPFIESHFWRLPIFFANLYLKQINKVTDKKEEMDYSHFFARATLAILERFYNPSASMIGVSHQELTKTEKEELLVAFTFQILIICSGEDNNDAFRSKVCELYNKINKCIVNVKRTELRDIHGEDLFDLLNNFHFDALEEAYSDMIDKADFTDILLPKEHLIKSCQLLIENICLNLENLGSTLYYVDKLSYISKYAESRDVSGFKDGRDTMKYRWIYGKSQGIPGLELFWTTCLVGVFLLEKELDKYEPKLRKNYQDPLLIKIRDYFQKDADPWANLIIGSIGCTFGIDPLVVGEYNGREKGIKLKSLDGKWISPENAKCKYNHESERICYEEDKKAL